MIYDLRDFLSTFFSVTQAGNRRAPAGARRQRPIRLDLEALPLQQQRDLGLVQGRPPRGREDIERRSASVAGLSDYRPFL